MRFLVVCVLVVASVVRAEYPAGFPKCKNGDEPCQTKAANEVLKKHFSGLRDINLTPFDPLHIKSVTLDRNPSSPVDVDLKFNDVDLIGLKNMIIKSFTGLNADFSGRTVVVATVPTIELKGLYKMEGHVLFIPIVGEGACHFSMKNVNVVFSTDLKGVEKNGKPHATLEHVKLDLDIGPSTIHLDNLFNGDKALSDNMNKILNESSKEIIGELTPSLAKALGLIVKQLINSFFDKYPYADYFN